MRLQITGLTTSEFARFQDIRMRLWARGSAEALMLLMDLMDDKAREMGSWEALAESLQETLKERRINNARARKEADGKEANTEGEDVS